MGTGVIPGGSKLGDRPKRTRGWYRAAKRGEAWAVRWVKLTPFARILERYLPMDLIIEQMEKRSLVFERMIPRPDLWVGSIIMPLKFGKDDEDA